MTIRKPRKPTRLPTGGRGSRTFTDSAETLSSKLERIEEARARRAGVAPPIHVSRPAPSGRMRRVPTAEDLLAGAWDTDTSTVEHPGRMPTAEELLSGAWDAPPEVSAQDFVMPTAEQLLSGEWDSQAPETSATSTEYYSPTSSIDPGRPRTLEMIYDRQTRILRVVFRDGGTYDYFGVPGPIWYRIRKVKSPGRFIDRNVKGAFEYERVAL